MENFNPYWLMAFPLRAKKARADLKKAGFDDFHNHTLIKLFVSAESAREFAANFQVRDLNGAVRWLYGSDKDWEFGGKPCFSCGKRGGQYDALSGNARLRD